MKKFVIEIYYGENTKDTIVLKARSKKQAKEIIDDLLKECVFLNNIYGNDYSMDCRKYKKGDLK